MHQTKLQKESNLGRNDHSSRTFKKWTNLCYNLILKAFKFHSFAFDCLQLCLYFTVSTWNAWNQNRCIVRAILCSYSDSVLNSLIISNTMHWFRCSSNSTKNREPRNRFYDCSFDSTKQCKCHANDGWRDEDRWQVFLLSLAIPNTDIVAITADTRMSHIANSFPKYTFLFREIRFETIGWMKQKWNILNDL